MHVKKPFARGYMLLRLGETMKMSNKYDQILGMLMKIERFECFILEIFRVNGNIRQMSL